MVYIEPKGGPPKKGPPKNAANKGKGPRQGGRDRGRDDELASKAEMLAQLTRQAEENTRILERERVALGIAGPSGGHDGPGPNGNARDRGRGAPGPGPGPGANARRGNNQHVFADHGNKKVFDPRQVPGLGGGGGGDRQAPGSPQGLNQTFPDSPNYFPGMIFAVPGTMPPPPPGQAEQQGIATDAGTLIGVPGVGGGGATVLPPPGPYRRQGQGQGPPMQQGYPQQPGGWPPAPPPGQNPYGPPQGGGPNPQSYGSPPPYGGGPPPQGPGSPYGQQAQPSPYGGPPGGPWGGPPPPMDPKVAAKMEADAKKEAYRRELEEQIRQKKQAKEMEERRQREEDAAWEGRAAQQAWEAAPRRGGGGGDPIRDTYGRPVADLRGRRMHAGGGSPPPMPGPQGQYAGPPGFAGRLSVEIPGGGAGYPPNYPPYPYPGGPDGGMGPPQGYGGPPMPMPGPQGMPMGGPPMGMGSPGHFDGQGMGQQGPPMGQQGGGSPHSIPPVSPGNRRFMAAMNGLLAGPSDEQKRNAEMARQRLQADLEMQIREKKERQAREKAEEERQRQKEEAELRSYFDRQEAQRQEEERKARMANEPQPPPFNINDFNGVNEAPARRRGKGPVVDASWLDAPKPPAQLPPLEGAPQQPVLQLPLPVPGMGPPDFRGRSANGLGMGGEGGPAPGAEGLTGVLIQMQEEQSKIREEFSRQAAAMEKFANEAGRAIGDRNSAWNELQSVQQLLAAGLAGEPIPGLPGPAGAGAAPGAAAFPGGVGMGAGDMTSSLMVIDTHMVSKDVNTIPEELPQPVASEVLRRNNTDPGPKGEGRGGGGGAPPGLQRDLSFDGAILSGYSNGMNGGRYQSQVRSAGAAPQGRNFRSGIPLPPGVGPPRSGPPLAPMQRGAYGALSPIPEPPPIKSRYNTFMDGEGAGGGGGGGGYRGNPRNLAPLDFDDKPISPRAILRADHLPSPTKHGRGGRGSAGGAGPGGRGRGAGGGGGPPERGRGPPGGGRGLSPPGRAGRGSGGGARSPGAGSPHGGLPPVPQGLARGHAARRSAEGLQNILAQRKRRSNAGASEDGGGPYGSPPGGYGGNSWDEIPAVAGRQGKSSSPPLPPLPPHYGGYPRSREPSNPGNVPLSGGGRRGSVGGGPGHRYSGGGGGPGHRMSSNGGGPPPPPAMPRAITPPMEVVRGALDEITALLADPSLLSSDGGGAPDGLGPSDGGARGLYRGESDAGRGLYRGDSDVMRAVLAAAARGASRGNSAGAGEDDLYGAPPRKPVQAGKRVGAGRADG
ncbi:hypothetical protein HYH03_007125 [Edaphochlamys debaryana]|uniref:Uncharacterized protein n=1 Tax=Edaphochlamys debaryana TaxID=47281 RepID=A0A835Y478_9CHLO|nr:hypothetical protein HYH03_007125 [Edaphochlamys debaryana]|eukprot:KAG2494887.1 hypothetical protein HYH03_007125 [Edaphochlamys debaryana]